MSSSTSTRRAHRRALNGFTSFVIGNGLAFSSFVVCAEQEATALETPSTQVADQASSDTVRVAQAGGEESSERLRVAEAAPSERVAAGGPIERVLVVHTRNREEQVQDVPLSISVVSGEELRDLSARDLGSITRRAANITWNTGNSRTSSLSIRGVGKQAQTDAQDPSVGIVVDGVPYAYNPLASFDFTDVDTVEVSRGPQGTLFGKNANLGIVNITTQRPSFEDTVDYSLAFGERNRFIGSAAAGGGLIDGLLAWRGALSVDRGDGYVKNAYNPDHTYNNHDRVSGRVQFLLTPTENFSARISADLQPRIAEYYNGLTFYKPTPTTYADGTPNPRNSDASTRLARRWFQQEENYEYAQDYLNAGNGNNSLNLDNQHPLITSSRGGSLTLNWRVRNFDLVSISAYRDYHFQARNDEGTPFDISKNGGGMVDKYQQTSQEFRISSEIPNVVDYQAGVYGVHSQLVKGNRVSWGADAGAWFANNSQYTLLDADSAGRQLLVNSLNRLDKNQEQHIDNKSVALFAQANWQIAQPVTLTTGFRFTREKRRNPGSILVTDNGYGGELNPVAVNGVQLGGFASANNGTLQAGNSIEQLQLADFVASKYFGVAATGTPGEAYSNLTAAQRAQIGAAKTLRQTQLGVLWNDFEPETFEDTQPAYVVSNSYKLTENINTYVSWQYGEKAGIAQQTNGLSTLAKPEKSSAFEWGIKSTLLDGRLFLNFDVFLNDVKDYQQAVQIFDEYTTTLRNDGTLYYVSATGNAAKVRVKGVEIDGGWSVTDNLSLTFAGAYNDAVYKDFKNSGQPPENGNLSAPYRDVSGQNLPGAAKYSFNIGGEYRTPVTAEKEFFTNFNTSYVSRNNTDVTLSSYGWVGSTTITDLSFGIGRQDRSLEVGVIVKNLFDADTPLAQTWNSWIPAVPRWGGLQINGKLR